MCVIFRCLSFLIALHGAVAWAQSTTPKSLVQLDVSGTWEASAAGFYGQLRQTDAVISGRCYAGANCVIRGAFAGDHVIITANWGHGDKQCRRGTFIAPNTGKLSPLVGKWHGELDRGDGLTRVSADPGEPATYPYEDELKECGDLVTYELFFDANSAELKNRDAPVLTALAELLKSDPSARLMIIVHTDETGAPDSNRKLSLDRALSLKIRLVELCMCEPVRITIEGMGSDQPLESNDNPAGRALNRRVEIILGR